MDLELEMETYQKNLPELLANEGKYVAISGDEILGVVDDKHEAMELGYEHCGMYKAFLVQKIEAEEQIYYIY